MKNYQIQDGCWNCKHLFTANHGDWVGTYCSYKAGKRPKSGAIVDGESFCFRMIDDKMENYSKSQFWKFQNAWDKWSKGREVPGHGICDNYKGGVHEIH